MALWIITLSLVLIIFIIICISSTRHFNYWKKKNVPYIKPIPIFGNLLPMFTFKQTAGEWFREIYNSMDMGYLGIYAFDQPVLVVKSPKILKHILIKNFTNFEDHILTMSKDDPVMSKMIFVQKNPDWRRSRSKLSPIFSNAKLKLMFPYIRENAEQMTKYLEQKIGSIVEIKEVCAKYATNVIAHCAFAVDAKSFENENAEFRQLGRKFFTPGLTAVIRQSLAFFLPVFVDLFKVRYVSPDIVDSLRKMFFSVIKERESTACVKDTDFIGLMLKLRENEKYDEDFNDSDLLAQSIQIFLASFETISTTIAFTLYELSNSRSIQDRLRKEILESVEQCGSLQYEQIQELKYLDMVVCETLRKYPVLPFLDRRCTEDFELPEFGVKIEKGIGVYIPIFGLHYDEKYFPNPYKFDPDRFADKSQINEDGITYLPFGAGPRTCLGNRFGLLNVKIGIASIVSNFQIDTCSMTPIPLKFDPKCLTLSSPVGIPLVITPLEINYPTKI
ncbi:hypothetical protein GWI33_004305 [Rhynchophorus ferrugineus]|uniref:Cytochrome P450 n=1 Tax=Rhynchophorus ferrugineus TaxID=354439 RepID=A0A834MGW5_RHYFE|nr:hypothetical protein GWI33_004305 [Rhynchophorus ferrugineus]